MIIKVDDLPKTLNETYELLDNRDLGEGMNDWLNMDVHKALGMVHSSLGQWIRNHLKLWEKESNLKEWFMNNFYLDHPDDISSLILINFHQRKNGLIPDLNKEAEAYHKHWEQVIPGYRLKVRNFKLKKLCLKLENM